MTKKIISIALTIIMSLSLLSISASAASYPSLSKNNYCEFTAAKNINVYTSSNTNTRGTSSPSKSYNAYIEKGDICYIYKITSKYIYLSYPVGNSRREGYIRTSDLLGGNISPSSSFTANKKVTTYKYNGGGKTGYYCAGDKAYVLSGNYYNVIYEAKSNKRGYKLAFAEDISNNNPTSNNSSKTKVWPVGGNGGTDQKNWPRYNNSGKYHSGTDISASKGTPVYATYSGVVDTAKTLTSSYGKHVIIKCMVNNKTVYIYYAHLNSYNVKAGDYVTAGQQIGTVGSTGNSTGPHLHYEVRNSQKHYGNINNPTLNPYNYLPNR